MTIQGGKYRQKDFLEQTKFSYTEKRMFNMTIQGEKKHKSTDKNSYKTSAKFLQDQCKVLTRPGKNTHKNRPKSLQDQAKILTRSGQNPYKTRPKYS